MRWAAFSPGGLGMGTDMGSIMAVVGTPAVRRRGTMEEAIRSRSRMRRGITHRRGEGTTGAMDTGGMAAGSQEAGTRAGGPGWARRRWEPAPAWWAACSSRTRSRMGSRRRMRRGMVSTEFSLP